MARRTHAAGVRARPSQVATLALSRATLGDLTDRLARTYGARAAVTLEDPIVLDGRPRTALAHVDVAEIVARTAAVLNELGVKRGDRVAVCTANRIDYALTCFAAVRVGAVAVPLHHHLKPGEVASLVERARARFLVADPETAVTRARLKTLTAGVAGSLAQLLADASPLAPVKVAPDDPAMILFTSGTTGTPKGATMSSRALLAVSRLAALVPDARDERGMCGLPLAHVMGMSTLLCALMAGAPIHWLTRFDARRVLERMQQQRSSFFIGVPAMYAMLAAEEPERFELGAMRLWASGADAMPPPLVERFARIGAAFVSPRGRPLSTAAFAEVYGMVELSGPAIVKFTPPAVRDDGPLSGPARRALQRPRLRRVADAAARLRHAVAGARADDDGALALGVPIPPYRIKIVDDAGKPVKAGVVGELVIKGPGVTQGYDADAAATAKVTADGWLKTGDLAWKNRLGLVAFATRKKDVVKHGGFSVFPAEVEAQLAAHPRIADVVVFGVPHPTKGASVAAAVVLRRGAADTEQDLLRWAREQIAAYKAPRLLAIVSEEAIPRNANKKVLKDQLRDTLLRSGSLVAAER